MKMWLSFLSFILLAAIVAPYFIKGPDGQPLMEAEEQLADLPDMGSVVPQGPVVVHRWQDENGVWHFSNEVAPNQSQALQIDGAGVTEIDSGASD